MVPFANDNICYQIKNLAFFFKYFVFNTAEMNRSDAQVRCDKMLRYPFNHLGLFPEQIQVPLLWCVPDKREEFSHVMQLPFKSNIEHAGEQARLGI